MTGHICVLELWNVCGVVCVNVQVTIIPSCVLGCGREGVDMGVASFVYCGGGVGEGMEGERMRG